MKVRVQNFQSLKDVTLDINGLTVVTGPNNSGKTALMRAIRGVFENSPSGPLVRHGQKQLTVDLEFEDGQTVTWEKGPKVNAYTINGYKLETVGRGVPEELNDLGVKPIQAGNTVIWPQIAKQFQGTLFLVNETGAVLGEALSDVEKVGRLNNALRLAEKDKRSVTSELKVREQDLVKQEEALQVYKGFDTLESMFEGLELLQLKLQKIQTTITQVQDLQDKYNSCKQVVEQYKDLEGLTIPDKSKVERLHLGLTKVGQLLTRQNNCKSTLNKYSGLKEVQVPTTDFTQLVSKIQRVQALNTRYVQCVDLVDTYQQDIPELPDSTKLLKIQSTLSKVLKLSEQLKSVQTQINTQQHSIQECEIQYHKVQGFIQDTLGELGECPVCKKVHND